MTGPFVKAFKIPPHPPLYAVLPATACQLQDFWFVSCSSSLNGCIGLLIKALHGGFRLSGQGQAKHALEELPSHLKMATGRLGQGLDQHALEL